MDEIACDPLAPDGSETHLHWCRRPFVKRSRQDFMVRCEGRLSTEKKRTSEMTLDECRHIIAAAMPGREDQSFGQISVGSTSASADEGARLILDGIKTATSSPLWDYPDGQIPFEGAPSVLIDGRDRREPLLKRSPLRSYTSRRCPRNSFPPMAREIGHFHGFKTK